jgi:hypothetical protein
MELCAWWRADQRRALRHVAASGGLLVVAAASLFVTWFVWFLESWHCSLGMDTDTVPPPAAASPQGWLCGEHAATTGAWIWDGAFLLSVVVTVALVALAWRRWSWRAGIPALALVVILPVTTSWLLNRPSDDCSASARATHPVWACARAGSSGPPDST